MSVHLEFVDKAAKLSTIEETPQHVVRGLVEDIIVKHGVAPFGHFQQALLNIAVEMRLQQPIATEKDLDKCFRLIQPCSSNRVAFDVLAPTIAASTVYVASKGA